MADKTRTDSHDVSGGITDITDTPDVAVWSKEIRSNMHMPSDRVKEPSKVASTTLHAGQTAVDPADKRQVSKAVIRDIPLTDESDPSK